MNNSKKIEDFNIYANDITDRAKMLFYMTNLRQCVGTRHLDSESDTESYAESNFSKSNDSQYGSGVYDLLIQSDPDQDSLLKAYESLRPGAYIYTEHSVPFNSKAAQISNNMQSVGFDKISLYFLKPDPSISLPKIYIPLGVPGAIEYLIETSYRTTTTNMLRRMSHIFRKLLWSISPKLFLNYPGFLGSGLTNFTICTLARKPLGHADNKKTVLTSEDNTNTRKDLFEGLLEGWETRGLGRKPDKLCTLILARGRDTYTKLILLVFSVSEPVPALVIKIPLTLESDLSCSNEEKILNILNRPEKRIERIPKIVFSEKVLNHNIISQSYLDGVPLSYVINSENFRELATSTTYFLTRIAHETKCEVTKDWKEIYINQVLSDLESCISSILKPGTIKRSYEILEDFNLPIFVCEHSDLAPVNVNINDKGEIGIMDWESSRLRGIPALDLIFFLTRICIDHKIEPGTLTTQERYQKMIDPNTFSGAVFSDCINYYTSELDIPHAAIPSLRLMTYIAQAHIKFLEVATGTLKFPDKLSVGKLLVTNLWEEELRINGGYEY